jgi:hypothetical protein
MSIEASFTREGWSMNVDQSHKLRVAAKFGDCCFFGTSDNGKLMFLTSHVKNCGSTEETKCSKLYQPMGS